MFLIIDIVTHDGRPGLYGDDNMRPLGLSAQ